jgi:hypothetical protein
MDYQIEQINRGFLDFSAVTLSKPDERAEFFSLRWHRLCEAYLPVKSKDSIWRFNREAKPQEPSQGWKLHISATILEACDLFEKVAPFLISQGVQFKAPESLNALFKINCGLQYGYWQVGKFITVYPSTEKKAVKLAGELHELTSEFISIAVPFDERYLPHSSVFYRYGAFAQIEMKDKNGIILPAIKNPSGELVYDDRFRAVPEWLSDPFRNKTKKFEDSSETVETPLMTTYKVLRAITQRGKGGTYIALDLSADQPRLCIVKEGRRHGEVYWNNQDGYHLVKNEFDVLNTLGKIYKDVPQVFSSFEADGNFYLVMEYVEGKSLYALMRFRRRRFSVKQVIKFSVEIARIIEEIHQAGWVWNDCKPANLIVTPNGSLRPIDFEGSYPAHESAPFDWKSDGFSNPAGNESSSGSIDFYALGAVVYFLLTGKLYMPDAPVAIEKLRRNVPKRFLEIVENLLCDSDLKRELLPSEVREEFESIAATFTD